MIIGNSSHSKKISEIIKIASKCDYSVLILGESGVGKELVAKSICMGTDNINNSFSTINCANLPESLIDSELFGYKKGAFTDAKTDKIGLLESRTKGSLFFDEISELSPYLQAKLLRVIENKEIRMLGGNSIKKISTRFIFASNINIKLEIKKNRFRQDLYYRISTIEISIPPLRERKSDIPILANHFLKIENNKFGENKKFGNNTTSHLKDYQYPGNIRELQNIIRRAFIFTAGNVIHPEDIRLHNNTSKNTTITKKQLEKSLEINNMNKTRVAKDLNISRQWLYRILSRYNLD